MDTTTHISCTVRRDQAIPRLSSERGIALIVVLLLMAVLSGLATGFAMTGQVEVQMGTNEVYYAGARAAAEAGLNRAIV
jgi:type II secretory pathway component PulK